MIVARIWFGQLISNCQIVQNRTKYTHLRLSHPNYRNPGGPSGLSSTGRWCRPAPGVRIGNGEIKRQEINVAIVYIIIAITIDSCNLIPSCYYRTYPVSKIFTPRRLGLDYFLLIIGRVFVDFPSKRSLSTFYFNRSVTFNIIIIIVFYIKLYSCTRPISLY